MELSLTKLPWYAQIGAFVVLAVAGVGLFYWYYERPTRADIVTRETQLRSLQADINKGVNTARQLPEFRAQVDDLENRLGSLRAVLPEEKDAADLLRNLQNVAAQSNLTIRSFRPAASITRELHAEWPISLELNGTYHDLAQFFDRVGKFTRIVNISNLSISAAPRGRDARGGETIRASAVATTFVLIDPAAATAAKPAKGGRRAAKKAS